MSAPINTKVKASKPCPCGCGKMLYPYRDGMPLVCPDTWRRAASDDRRVIMLPGATVQEKRVAVRSVLELARAIKRRRDVKHPVPNSEAVRNPDRTGWTDTEEGWSYV